MLKTVSICCLAVLSTLHADPANEVDHPPFPAEDFAILFDGKNLEKFTTEGNWKVNDGKVIELVPRPGEEGWERYGSYLWFPGEDYADFTADFEFKYEKGGNTGFYFAVSDRVDATANGFEVQILDSFGETKKLIHHDMGGVINTSPASENASLAPGEWNRITVTYEKGHLTVILNDKKVQDIDLAEKKPADKALAEKGSLAIQDHGQPLFLRNIQVKKLD